ncbi:hypothetical protein EYR40_006418 [Pleurotus pulmonarius]|nr:hypothetical protein EYR40_006418 [Pleurotus pulmonarius]
MGPIPGPNFIHPGGLCLRADPNSYTMRRVLKLSSMSITFVVLVNTFERDDLFTKSCLEFQWPACAVCRVAARDVVERPEDGQELIALSLKI